MPEEFPLVEMLLAAGALGTAAFGIVEGLKWLGLDRSGFSKIPGTLGKALMGALGNAYGPDYLTLLVGQYQNGRAKGELPRSLRQGMRIGLRPDNAAGMAEHVGVVEAKDMTAIAEKLRDGVALEAAEKSVLGRFELAVDARIDAALSFAERTYLGCVRWSAIVLSVLLALVAAWVIRGKVGGFEWETALIVGVAAVPLAPVAKDLSKALHAAANAIGARK